MIRQRQGEARAGAVRHIQTPKIAVCTRQEHTQITHIHTHTHAYTRSHTCIHTLTHMHTHAHTHAYTRSHNTHCTCVQPTCSLQPAACNVQLATSSLLLNIRLRYTYILYMVLDMLTTALIDMYECSCLVGCHDYIELTITHIHTQGST